VGTGPLNAARSVLSSILILAGVEDALKGYPVRGDKERVQTPAAQDRSRQGVGPFERGPPGGRHGHPLADIELPHCPDPGWDETDRANRKRSRRC